MMFTALIFILCLGVHFNAANESVIVHTQYGDVLGYQTGLARIFYGIPFAQPPIDALRWKPPVPITKWSPATLNATAPAPACPQPSNSVFSIRTPSIMSEDCLYLNIFTPISSSTSSNNSLPVMIFIHGGNFQFGDASSPELEAEHLVNTTGVIVALIQYRLGVFGFLATGNGSNDINGNYGILDQRLAISWIKENINSFGGNATEITIFGQSAGAQAVAIHYVTSEMQPFFQRAIIQSSPMPIPFRTYLEYIVPGGLLAEELHCALGDVACYRSRSTTEIVTAQGAVNRKLSSLNILIYFEPWLPVIDQRIIHGQLLEVVGNLSFPLKPLIIGTVTEEGRDFVYQTLPKPLSSSEYIAACFGIFGRQALKVIAQYPPDGSDDQRSLISKIITQWVFSCPTRAFARHTPAFSYVFGYPYDKIQCTDHACHGDDVPFTFESRWDTLTPAGRRVSQAIATYWTNLAKTDDPNEPMATPLYWSQMTPKNQTYTLIDDPPQSGTDYLKNDCDFWDTIGYK